MTRWLYGTGMVSLMLVMGSGCPGMNEDSIFPILASVDGEQVFYQYIHFDSARAPQPWVTNLQTGESRLIEEQAPFNLQGAGDYYVFQDMSRYEFEGPSGSDGSGLGLVAVRISTGKRITIIEQNYDPLEPYGIPLKFILNSDRVMILVDHQLRLFDLPTESFIKILDVPNDTEWLGGFRGNQVLVGRGEGYDIKSAMIINLLTDEIIEVPPPPGNRQIFAMEDAQLSDTWFALRTSAENTEAEDFGPTDILLFDIPTLSWKVLVQNTTTDLDNIFVLIQGFYLFDINETHLVFGSLSLSFLGNTESRTDLIELETGERRVIGEPQRAAGAFFGNFTFPRLAMLHDNQVYSIDASSHSLVIYDIASETQRTVPLAPTIAN